MAEQGKQGKALIGLAAIAQYLGSSRYAVKRAMKQQGLPAVRTPSGQWLSHRDAIDDWCLRIVLSGRRETTVKSASASE